jgi:hypothetical protein
LVAAFGCCPLWQPPPLLPQSRRVPIEQLANCFSQIPPPLLLQANPINLGPASWKK